ncbi:MAG: hypothetical protein WAZ18_02675 [Alphaproteobacteria bacterium]
MSRTAATFTVIAQIAASSSAFGQPLSGPQCTAMKAATLECLNGINTGKVSHDICLARTNTYIAVMGAIIKAPSAEDIAQMQKLSNDKAFLALSQACLGEQMKFMDDAINQFKKLRDDLKSPQPSTCTPGQTCPRG